MDIFFFQLVIIFLPGLIWERVDAQYLQKRVPTQFDVLRRTFVFGLVAYLVTYAIADLAGLRFEFVKPNKDEIFLGVTAVNQVIVTTVAAFICSILWMYFVKLDLLTKVVHLIGASKQFGDEDVWDFTFNARRQERRICAFAGLRQENRLCWLGRALLRYRQGPGARSSRRRGL